MDVLETDKRLSGPLVLVLETGIIPVIASLVLETDVLGLDEDGDADACVGAALFSEDTSVFDTGMFASLETV